MRMGYFFSVYNQVFEVNPRDAVSSVVASDERDGAVVFRVLVDRNLPKRDVA